MARVIEGFNISKGKVRTKKRYRWFIPKEFDDKVSKGDVVYAAINDRKGNRRIVPVLVIDILEKDDTIHKPVVGISKKYKEISKNSEVKKKSKISEEEREIIRGKRSEGKTLKELAEMYSCSISLIHKIINEKQGEINE